MSAVAQPSAPDIATVQELVAGRVATETADLAQPAAADFTFNVLSGADLLKLPRPSWRVKGVLFRLKPVIIGTDEDGQPITSCIVEAVEGSEAESQEAARPLPRSLQYALDSLLTALEMERSASVHVDVWRQHFYADHPADTEAGKRQAFHRARKDLIEHGKISVVDNIYSVTERDNGVTCHYLSRSHGRGIWG